MNAAELAAIRARAAKATPGPWWARMHGDKVVAIESAPTPILENAESSGLDPLEVGEDDADFIAAARMDIPALLEEVDLLRDALGYLQGEGSRLLTALVPIVPQDRMKGLPDLHRALKEIDYLVPVDESASWEAATAEVGAAAKTDADLATAGYIPNAAASTPKP